MSTVKRGVSLYSFQEEYFLHQASLEDLIARSAEMGALGIETIAEQMMPGFPNIPDDFYRMWQGWMEKYGTHATAHDMFADTKLHKNRLLTTQEMVDEFRFDITHIRRLGGNVIRVLVITPIEVIAAVAPFAIENGVKLLLEVHSPFDFEHPHIQAVLELGRQFGPEWVGLMPDMGIFVERLPRVITERAMRDGAQPELVDRIAQAYAAGETGPALVEEIERRGGTPRAVFLARQAAHYISRDPRQMLEYMPFIHHIHGKFYEMTAEGVEPSIPYDRIVAVLVEGGFDGHISSEYEGNRHIQDAFAVDSFTQVRRHQDMLKRLLGEEAA